MTVLQNLGLEVARFEAKTDNISNEGLFSDEKPESINRYDAALNRMENSTRQS